MLIDLSWKIYPGMTVYPGTPEEAFIPESRIKNGALNNTTKVVHFLHVGTHVDAPYHFDEKGETIDEVPLERFLYRNTVLLEIPKSQGELIEKEDLLPYKDIKDIDLLLLYTGYCVYKDNAAVYCGDFPALSQEAAIYLRDSYKNLKAIGIDTMSIDPIDGESIGFPAHHALLDSRGRTNTSLLVFENVDLTKIRGKNIEMVYAFPLRFVGLDASPVAMVAQIT